MRQRLSLVLFALLLHGAAALAGPDSLEAATSPANATATPATQICPVPPGQRLDTAQISQTDCCKGHKGVCGCRAGKIVCCDNTTSPACTCHSDWGVEN